MDRYKRKQFTIAVVFVLIVVIVGYGIYFLTRSNAPTCFDGIQNQREQEIDCGGPCGECEKPQSLSIIFQGFIATAPSDFDLVAKIKNPNNNWGIESLDYQFNIYDLSDNLIGTRQGKTYFLPQETKYIIEQRMTTKMDPAKIEIELKNINWRKLKDFEELDIRIRDKELKIIGPIGHQLVGNVENKSSYDLDQIEVTGLLYNKGRLIGVGKTDMNTVLMDETRYFEISWPYQISEEITSFDLKPHTNIYLNENFLKTHETQERFKEY